MKKISYIIVLLTTFTFSIAGQKAEKVTVDELVRKHLDSIGQADDRSPSISRIFVGKASLRSKVGSTFLLSGDGQLASVGDSVVFAAVFDSKAYPYDKIGFDGKDITVGLPNGNRTILADYIKTQPSILRDGLFGGALSTAWPLFDLKANPKAKLEMAGTTKIDDKNCYKVKYSSSRTGELKITMFFDAETFRHVRTQYEYTIEPRIGTSPTDVRSNSQLQRYTLQEDFSDFKKAGKLTLPTSYKVTVSNAAQIETLGGNSVREWSFIIENAYYNQPIPPESFRVS